MHRNIQTNIQTYIQTDIQKDIQTDIQTEIRTDKQADRPTDVYCICTSLKSFVYSIKLHCYSVLSRMVLDNSGDLTDRLTMETNRRQAMRTARCVRILGKGVVKVVHRCDDAKENNVLGK